MIRKAVLRVKLLEDIYFGNLAPNEIEIEKGSDMDIQLKSIIQCEEELTSQLNENQKILFENVPSPKKQTKNAGKKPNEKNDEYNIKLLYPTAFIPRFA